jgi:thioredoxin-dependent peroxiredoxin
VARLHKGDPAPDFELSDERGKTWRLADLRGRRVVVYFYPADDTPGCTTQACDFRDAHAELADNGYLVLGISPQSGASHRAFSTKHGLNFPLLIDDGYHAADSYGVKSERRRSDGDVSHGVTRSTFVIDEEGTIVEALYAVKARGHVESLKRSLHM